MNITNPGVKILATLALAASLGGCATWEESQTADGPYYESYGYPDDYRGPGYYGPGYYQPGYYGGYWYGGGYYSPAYPGGYYAPYPYYPGTHVVIVDRNRPPPNRSGDGDTRQIPRRPGDPRGPQPQGHRDDDRQGPGYGNGDRDRDRDRDHDGDPRYGRDGRDGRGDERREPEHPFGIPDRAYNPQNRGAPARDDGDRRGGGAYGARNLGPNAGPGAGPNGGQNGGPNGLQYGRPANSPPRQDLPPLVRQQPPASPPVQAVPQPPRPAVPPPQQIYRQSLPERRAAPPPGPERSGDRQPGVLER